MARKRTLLYGSGLASSDAAAVAREPVGPNGHVATTPDPVEPGFVELMLEQDAATGRTNRIDGIDADDTIASPNAERGATELAPGDVDASNTLQIYLREIRRAPLLT